MPVKRSAEDLTNGDSPTNYLRNLYKTDLFDNNQSYDMDSMSLELNWATKMRITQNFDQLSWCLTKKRIPDAKKTALIAENFELLKILLDLSSEEEIVPKDPKSVYKRIKKEEDNYFDHQEDDRDIPILLPWVIRGLIVEYLFKNHFMITKKTATLDDRIKLRVNNFKLNDALNSLEVSPLAEIKLDDSDVMEDPPVDPAILAKNFSNPDQFKDLMLALQQNYRPTAITNPPLNEPSDTTIEYKFKLSLLKEWKVLHSPPTQFKGLAWRVKVLIREVTEPEKKEMFGVLLSLEDNADATVQIDFKVYNHKNNFFNVKQHDYTFDRPYAKGYPNYLAMDQLTEESGFVKGDEVVVIIQLKVINCNKKA